tara:strand:- start:473 stop:817 length:345 start_codon:yes stop_codon:yes gene_type:complete
MKAAILKILTSFPFNECVLEQDLTILPSRFFHETAKRITPLDYEKQFEDKLKGHPKKKRGGDELQDRIAAEIYFEAYQDDLPNLFGSIARILRAYEYDEAHEQRQMIQSLRRTR